MIQTWLSVEVNVSLTITHVACQPKHCRERKAGWKPRERKDDTIGITKSFLQ